MKETILKQLSSGRGISEIFNSFGGPYHIEISPLMTGFYMKGNSVMKELKCSKTTWNWPEQPVELTNKLAAETAAPRLWHCFDVTNIAHCW